MAVIIRPLTTADLPAARQICHAAFGTFMGAPDPWNFWADRDYVYGRFGAEHIASFAAELDGMLVGSNFAVRWGSVGFFGPVSVHPNRWGHDIGQQLVAAVSRQFDDWGVSHAGLFTFPHSTLHIALYGKFGFHPRFLTAVMAAPAQSGSARPLARHSELSPAEQQAAEAGCREVTEAVYPGLDLGGEIRTVAARGLGDTVLLRDDAGGIAGFAICHWGPASEAGDKTCFIKFGAVRPGVHAETQLAALLDGCRSLAATIGMPTLLAGVNLGREEAYRLMLARGFRTHFQGVTMHRPNDPGYSRPGLFVLDDWR